MIADHTTPTDGFAVRARDLLRVRAVWALPLVLASVVVGVMTAFYMASVVDPLSHLHGLPVAVVNQDRDVMTGAQRLDIGQQVRAGLLASPVAGPLRLEVMTLPAAERVMDRGGTYATVVIPPDFTAALLTEAGLPAAGATAGRSQIEILTSQRAGTVGVSLASGLLRPALDTASQQIGRQLAMLAGASGSVAATRAFLASPITVVTSPYRPLPANSGLGASAFYLALLTLMCGFLAGTIVHTSVDATLGYATTDIGPRWRQAQPLPISRLQTLIAKWMIAAALTAVLSGLMLAVAAGVVGTDTPHPVLLLLYTWLCSASVAAGTIVLFAVLGTPGQMVAILAFIYAGLASAGGIVPVEALPAFLRWLSQVEPLRQILVGTRAILYFGAQANAGLTRGASAAGLGLLFWLVAGVLMVRWYDRRRLHRMDPELLAYVSTAVQVYRERHGGARTADSSSANTPATWPD